MFVLLVGAFDSLNEPLFNNTRHVSRETLKNQLKTLGTKSRCALLCRLVHVLLCRARASSRGVLTLDTWSCYIQLAVQKARITHIRVPERVG